MQRCHAQEGISSSRNVVPVPRDHLRRSRTLRMPPRSFPVAGQYPTLLVGLQVPWAKLPPTPMLIWSLISGRRLIHISPRPNARYIDSYIHSRYREASKYIPSKQGRSAAIFYERVLTSPLLIYPDLYSLDRGRWIKHNTALIFTAIASETRQLEG